MYKKNELAKHCLKRLTIHAFQKGSFHNVIGISWSKPHIVVHNCKMKGKLYAIFKIFCK